MRVDFKHLSWRSVFDDPRLPKPRLMTLRGPCGEAVEIPLVECEGVHYLPSLLERGQSLCLLNQDTVPLESILFEWTLEFVKERRNDPVRLADRYAQEFAAKESDFRVCILGNVFSRNFAHWTEELLKVVVLENLGVKCHYVFSSLPPFAASFLDHLGISADRILSPFDPVKYKSAFFIPAINHENIPQFPQVASLFRHALLSPLAGIKSPYRKRLWLERGKLVTNGGNTLNRQEVHDCLVRYGFESLDMAALSVREQLTAVKDAEAIAGPHGAQFAHIMFLPPRSKVIECFSPIHVNPSVLQICRLLGHSYHQVVSRSHLLTPVNNTRDLVIDIEHLKLLLDFHFGDARPLVDAGCLG